jgi:transposase-like protein
MNLVEVIREFKTDDDCRNYLEKLRWPDGVRCIRCKSSQVRRLSVPDKKKRIREIVECKSCAYQFSVTAGTIFHDSHLPLTKWFLVVALMCESKKGISAHQIHRSLKINYRTAWYLCHRIRKAMENGELFGRTNKLGSGCKVVESDETYIGGKYDKRRKRAKYEKPGVQGIVERGGSIRVMQIPTASAKILTENLKTHVADDVKFVATDELPAYKKLGKFFPHRAVKHTELQWVRGIVHTNTIEGFWSLFNRQIIGAHHQISTKHLHRYLNESEYRFNRRKEDNLFSRTLAHMVTTCNMPYAKLIEKPKESTPF